MELLFPTFLISFSSPPAASFPSITLFSFLSFWDSPDEYFNLISQAKHVVGLQNIISCLPNLISIHKQATLSRIQETRQETSGSPPDPHCHLFQACHVSNSSHKPTWARKCEIGTLFLRDDLESLVTEGDADAQWLLEEQHSHPEKHEPGLEWSREQARLKAEVKLGEIIQATGPGMGRWPFWSGWCYCLRV